MPLIAKNVALSKLILKTKTSAAILPADLDYRELQFDQTSGVFVFKDNSGNIIKFGDTSDLAHLASPGFTGLPTAPTAAPGTNSTQLATCEFVLENNGEEIRTPVVDANYTVPDNQHRFIAYTSITAARTVTLPPATVAGQRVIVADQSGSVTTTLKVTLSRAGTDTINGATSQVLDYAYGVLILTSNGAGKWNCEFLCTTKPAGLASPAFSGNPTATTQAVDTNSTRIATTAFIQGQKGTATPLMDGTAVPGTSMRWSPIDHVHPNDTTRAPIDNPAFTGVPTAPTAAVGTDTDQIATTAFVLANGVAGGGAFMRNGSLPMTGSNIFRDVSTASIIISGGTNITGDGAVIAAYGANNATLPGGLQFLTPNSAKTAMVEALRIVGCVDVPQYVYAGRQHFRTVDNDFHDLLGGMPGSISSLVRCYGKDHATNPGQIWIYTHNTAKTAWVPVMGFFSGDAPYIDAQSHLIRSVAAPVAGGDAVNKTYSDSRGFVITTASDTVKATYADSVLMIPGGTRRYCFQMPPHLVPGSIVRLKADYLNNGQGAQTVRVYKGDPNSPQTDGTYFAVQLGTTSNIPANTGGTWTMDVAVSGGMMVSVDIALVAGISCNWSNWRVCCTETPSAPTWG